MDRNENENENRITSERLPSVPAEEDVYYPRHPKQVDLFAYAEQLEHSPTAAPEQDKSHYTIDDAAIPDLGIPATEPPVERPVPTESADGPTKFRLGKTGIAIVAAVTAAAVLLISMLSVYLNFYGKMDYIADDKTAYYYAVKADGIKHSPLVKNILLIGTDERTQGFSDNARSDSMMILSINSATGTVNLVSLERGMTVPYLKSASAYSSDLLTHVFKHGGAGLLINTVENTFKINIDGYVRVNFHTFAQIIDRLGGVDIELTADEVRGLNTEKHKGQVVRRKLSEGLNHLSGEEALLYARLRWIDSDFQRVKRQRKVILAIKEQMKGQSYFQLASIAGDILPLMQTNLSAGDMAGLLLRGSLAMGGETQQMTVPFKGTYSKLSTVDFDRNAAMLQEALYG